MHPFAINCGKKLGIALKIVLLEFSQMMTNGAFRLNHKAKPSQQNVLDILYFERYQNTCIVCNTIILKCMALT